MLSVYRLPGTMPGEKIVKVVRRDLFILFKKFSIFLLLGFLPLSVAYILWTPISGIIQANEALHAVFIMGASFYYLFIWLFFFFSFIDYYLDVWIITDERIIATEQHGFFSRVIAEQRLYRIQDVASEIHGFFPTIMSFGEVYIQTAGETHRFTMKEVPEPDKTRDIIIKLARRSKKIHAKKTGQRTAEGINEFEREISTKGASKNSKKI